MQRVVILISSGLDSSIANYLSNKNPDTFVSDKECKIEKVYFNFNDEFSNFEKQSISKNISNFEKIKEIEISGGEFNKHKNLSIASMAQTLFDADVVIINYVKDDFEFNQSFMSDYSSILSENAGKNVKVKSIFWDFEKTEIMNMYKEFEGEESLLDLFSNSFSYLFETTARTHWPVFKLEEGIHIKYKDVEMYGDMANEYCYIRNCSLAYCGMFIPFFNKQIIMKYRNFKSDDLPIFTEANKIYQNFLNKYFNFDSEKKGIVNVELQRLQKLD